MCAVFGSEVFVPYVGLLAGPLVLMMQRVVAFKLCAAINALVEAMSLATVAAATV